MWIDQWDWDLRLKFYPPQLCEQLVVLLNLSFNSVHVDSYIFVLYKGAYDKLYLDKEVLLQEK